MTLARPARLLFIAPAVIYLVALTQAPFVLTLWYSFQRWILTSPELGVTFVGSGVAELTHSAFALE